MDALVNLIQSFSIENLQHFFRQKLSSFSEDYVDYSYLFENKPEVFENYDDIQKVGEGKISLLNEILVFAAHSKKELTSRSSKKRQYDIAKAILKEEVKDAAFFVFYDDSGNFRFSFVEVVYQGQRRTFTSFKRYTYYVSPRLTNKTFIRQINRADFTSLESIKEAFSVEPVTKEFYQKLQHWYFWALENVQFPPDAEKETNGREISVIRLITRLMFIWFMRVRGLIPDDLFDPKFLTQILKDFSDEESSYYKAVLQNLFFATLNTPQDKRRFRTKETFQGKNKDRGNDSVFRYEQLLSDPQKLFDIFSKIPFLNGGLFECLDKRTKANESVYIDGFTDR